MLSWPEALAIVGSVGTVALTCIQILGSKSKKDDSEKIAVLENEIANLYERIDSTENSVEKIQDLFIQMLKDDRD